MPQRGRQFIDYEPVTRSRQASLRQADADATQEDWPPRESVWAESVPESSETKHLKQGRKVDARPDKKGNWILRRGHALSYMGLFLFTSVLYFRPYELAPALAVFSSIAFVFALFTLIAFLPSQLVLEGNLTARPREVNLVLLLCLTGLLSIPLAIDPSEAWATFNDTFIRAILMFIVMVNVIRTERRLKGMILLAIAVSCVLSMAALRDHLTGNLTVEGYRVAGAIGGMFGNPNDMALHLVTIFPLVAALYFHKRGPLGKVLYGACMVLMMAGVTVTYSRSGFLGLMCAILVMAWKIGKRNRLAVVMLVVLFMGAFFVFAPGGYANRVASIVSHSRDRFGSAYSRQALLVRSVLVAARHPLLGIGMGNFHHQSFREQVSHNAYTQVASEMGATALVLYVLFIITPLRKLKRVEDETFEARRKGSARFYYYLSVGMQTSLIAYMVSSFFSSVAYQWYIYYLVGYAVCLRRMYESKASAQLRDDAAAEVDGGHAREEANGRHGGAPSLEASGGRTQTVS
jgi:probable O-glycosylation ligase (exosortase A-associated)